MLSYLSEGSAYFLVPCKPRDYTIAIDVKTAFFKGAAFKVAGCDTICTYADLPRGLKVKIYFNKLTKSTVLEVK